MPTGSRYQGSSWEPAERAKEPVKTTAAPVSQARPTALSRTPRPGACQAVFQAYWRAFTTPRPVHRRPGRPSAGAAFRLVSAGGAGAVVSWAVSDGAASRTRTATGLARSLDGA